MHTHRKLLVLGLNELLERRLLSLDSAMPVKDGHLQIEIADEPSVIIWRDIGSDEIELSVWWKYEHAKHPQKDLQGNQCESFHGPTPLSKPQHYPNFVGAFASGWLNRRDQAHLQGYGAKDIFEKYTRRGEEAVLQAIPTPAPMGFKIDGPSC